MESELNFLFLDRTTTKHAELLRSLRRQREEEKEKKNKQTSTELVSANFMDIFLLPHNEQTVHVEILQRSR